MEGEVDAAHSLDIQHMAHSFGSIIQFLSICSSTEGTTEAIAGGREGVGRLTVT